MPVPEVLNQRFPPSPTQFFEVACRNMDDSMLLEVAHADYGIKAEETFLELKALRQQPDPAPELSWQLWEVLALSRWDNSRYSGTRASRITAFTCAALAYCEFITDSESEASDSDSTLSIGLVSTAKLEPNYSEALAGLLTWRFPRENFPDLIPVALLTLACRLHPLRITEQDLNEIATWVLAEDALTRRYSIKFPKMSPFSMQCGFWKPVADELEQHAMKIADPPTRENIQLCHLLLT